MTNALILPKKFFSFTDIQSFALFSSTFFSLQPLLDLLEKLFKDKS